MHTCPSFSAAGYELVSSAFPRDGGGGGGLLWVIGVLSGAPVGCAGWAGVMGACKVNALYNSSSDEEGDDEREDSLEESKGFVLRASELFLPGIGTTVPLG